MYAIGEIAKETGVTIRTLRYYDEIGLLKPSDVVNGRRYYEKEDIERLQKICTFKYLGISLERIGVMLDDEEKNGFKEALINQRNMLKEKQKEIQLITEVINNSIEELENNNEIEMDNLKELIKAVDIELAWTFQFKDPSNLNARINIHNYSTAKIDWYRWYFENILKKVKGEDIKLLEIACGDGQFLSSNKDIMPKEWELTLSDISVGMIKQCEKNFINIDNKVDFKVIDAENIKENKKYDVIIGNHFLYYVNDINDVLQGIKLSLKNNGIFFTSTVGESHMKEIGELVNEFDETMNVNTNKPALKFGFQNGKELLGKYFEMVEMKIHPDSLWVTEEAVLTNYILSFPFEGSKTLKDKKLDQFRCFISNKINKNGGIKITKETGFFMCK